MAPELYHGTSSALPIRRRILPPLLTGTLRESARTKHLADVAGKARVVSIKNLTSIEVCQMKKKSSAKLLVAIIGCMLQIFFAVWWIIVLFQNIDSTLLRVSIDHWWIPVGEIAGYLLAHIGSDKR